MNDFYNSIVQKLDQIFYLQFQNMCLNRPHFEGVLHSNETKENYEVAARASDKSTHKQ
jgi:hypothetical protein